MEDLRYYLKKPDGKTRRTFSLVCYRAINRKKKEYVELTDTLKADVNSINKKLKQKVIDRQEAEVLFNDLINAQYRKSKVQQTVLKAVVLSETNSKVLQAFWADKYAVKYIEDPRSARNDFERAFRAIEPHSIQSASQLDLHEALKKKLSNAKQIRRACDRLNEVLRWLKRDFKLAKPKKPKVMVRHISKADLLKLAQHIDCPECRILTQAKFATGCRIGEMMALVKTDLNGLELSVTKQRVNYGAKLEKQPKREKGGTIAVLEWGLSALKTWIAVEDKWAHREHFGLKLEQGCALAKVKRITPHDLRHSHAIHLLSLGATLTDVSLNLRDRIEVVQEHYTGYSHSEGTLERLKRIARQK